MTGPETSPSGGASPPAAPPSVFAGLLGARVTTAFDALLLGTALGGFHPLLASRRALALLAIWLAGALVLALARPVRRREGTQRAADPFLLLALFVLPLVVAPLAAWGERAHLLHLPGGTPRAIAGLALVAAGLALRIGAMRQLGSRFDPTVAILSDHVLETRGLYSRIRHPGYTGAWLASLGAALTFASGAGLFVVALFAVALGARVRREERVLEAHFGDAFRAWRARTGAFFPR